MMGSMTTYAEAEAMAEILQEHHIEDPSDMKSEDFFGLIPQAIERANALAEPLHNVAVLAILRGRKERYTIHTESETRIAVTSTSGAMVAYVENGRLVFEMPGSDDHEANMAALGLTAATIAAIRGAPQDALSILQSHNDGVIPQAIERAKA